MIRDRITDVILALADQREALAGVDVDPRIREEVDLLISEAIITLEHRRLLGRAASRNVVGS